MVWKVSTGNFANHWAAKGCVCLVFCPCSTFVYRPVKKTYCRTCFALWIFQSVYTSACFNETRFYMYSSAVPFQRCDFCVIVCFTCFRKNLLKSQWHLHQHQNENLACINIYEWAGRLAYHSKAPKKSYLNQS